MKKLQFLSLEELNNCYNFLINFENQSILIDGMIEKIENARFGISMINMAYIHNFTSPKALLSEILNFGRKMAILAHCVLFRRDN